MISFWFPPTNIMGAVRIGKFAKYLPHYGWEPRVLTVDKVKRDIPVTLPVEVEESKIERTPYFGFADSVSSKLLAKGNSNPQRNSRISNWRNAVYNWLVTSLEPIYHLPTVKLLTTDPIGWYPYAVKKGFEIINRHSIDVIFSSYGPSTAHLIASQLHKKTGIPWVADFRDFWAMEPNHPKTQPFQLLEEWIERRVVKGSSMLTTVSEPWARQLEAFHSKRAVVVTNGFDAEDYVGTVPLTSKFTLTHTGHLQHWDQRQLPHLFRAIDELRQEGKIHSNNFEARFFGGDIFGSSRNSALSLAEQMGIEQLVTVHGYIPFKESVKVQKESTALLLSRDNNPVSRGVYSGKIFEYLGAGRPILAMALKDDVIDQLLSESGTGKVVNQKDEIKFLLRQWINEFEKDGRIVTNYAPKAEVIERYTRKAQARKIAKVFDDIIRLTGKQGGV